LAADCHQIERGLRERELLGSGVAFKGKSENIVV